MTRAERALATLDPVARRRCAVAVRRGWNVGKQLARHAPDLAPDVRAGVVALLEGKREEADDRDPPTMTSTLRVRETREWKRAYHDVRGL